MLGHLFEQSITELERLHVIGLFGSQRELEEPTMPKSAQRKRSGTYYTPPDFTRLIVARTLGALIEERVKPLKDHRAQLEALRKVTVCDPACGSGAFLIAAYDMLEAAYFEILRLMRAEGDEEAESFLAEVAEWILGENLYGVDLQQESVEITQLALWIRSARKGRKLSDLSQHIVWGNSLVSDASVDERAMDWAKAFPTIFPSRDELQSRDREGAVSSAHDAARPLPHGRSSDEDSGAKKQGGFDVVIGNPPWERMKVQEREFFSLAAPEIASAVSAADRRKMIAKVEKGNPALWAKYQEAQAAAAKNLDYVRKSGAYPLTGKGDVNTYMVFAELARRIVAPTGRVGLLVPSGIATDDTTKGFFADLIEKQALVALYDFENRLKVFPDVDGRFKFSILLMCGAKETSETADFVFFAHRTDDLEEKERHITLTAKDFKLLNPNTRTCPIFRSRRDAELTKGIYRRVPILIDDARRQGGNPWGVKFCTMFHQTNDAELFKTGEELKKAGCKLVGNRWVKKKQVYLPLYEAKMIQAYDHRAASVVVEGANWFRQGQKEETSLVDHQNAEFLVIPRYWTEEDVIAKQLGQKNIPSLLAFKNVTSPTNQRTMIAAFLPPVGVINSAPLMLFPSGPSARMQCCLLANLNTFSLDYVARQKVGNVNLNFFIIEQLPMLPPVAYVEKCPWSPRQTLEKWISDRVLKLTCTAEDMRPLAKAAGFEEGIHRWNPRERAKLMAELDAAYFVLYGVERDDVEYILGTFQGVRDEDEQAGGAGPTRAAILEAYDAFIAR